MPSSQRARTSGRRASVFFRRRGLLGPELGVAMQGEGVSILDDPLHHLAFVELHGPRDRGREVDVPLFAVLAPNELNSGRVAHDRLLGGISLYT